MTEIVKTTLRGVPALWSKRIPFDCNGTLRAVVIETGSYQAVRLAKQFGTFAESPESRDNPFGQLPVIHGQALVNDMVDDGPIYVVYSYQTPIAWVTKSGTEVHPPVRYSVTTSKHQGKLHHQS